MTGQGIIVKLGALKDIEGADRIKRVEMMGETIITQATNKEGDLGILFDCETELSHEFCHEHNLYRHSNLNKDENVTGYFDDNRRVRPIKLKGIKVSAMWMPVDSLSSFGDTSALKVGDLINEFNNVKICCKYVTKATKMAANKQGKAKELLVKTFREHMDTDQMLRNMHQLKDGSLITITEKLHGTSFRCGNLQVVEKANRWQRFIANYITAPLTLGRVGKFKQWEPYRFVVGSRRVLKSIGGITKSDSHYYESDLWTKKCSDEFAGKLHKGETVYGEIVGYVDEGNPIMGSHSNSKLKPFLPKDEYKQLIDACGEVTDFNYGCPLGENKVFVYRITMTNEDGVVFDLSWQQVKLRCEELGVDYMPEYDQFVMDSSNITMDEEFIAELTSRPSEDFPNRIKEGICIRIDTGLPTPKIFKNKDFKFKVLEGIIKDADVVDIEESN